jgi:hypothetical protein
MSLAETHLSDARILIIFFTFSSVQLVLGFDACGAPAISSLPSQKIATTQTVTTVHTFHQ